MDYSATPRYVWIALIPPLLLLGRLLRYFRTNRDFFLDPVSLVLGIILLWSVTSLVWAIDPLAALGDIIQITSLLLLLILTIELHKRQELIRPTLFILIAGATLISIIGLQQSFNFNPFGYKQSQVPAATFINKNIAATYLDLVIPLFVYFLLFAKKNLTRWLTAVALAMAISYIVTIYSRGSWLGLFIASVAITILVLGSSELRNTFLSRLKQNAAKLICIIALVIIINILPQHVPDYSLERTNVLQTDVNMQIRLHAYLNTINMVFAEPFTGTGIGGFMLGFREHMFSPLSVPNVNETMYMVNLHNDPLQIISELGIIGGILLAFFLILIIQTGKHVIRNGGPQSKTLFIVLSYGLLASGVHSLVDFPLHRPTSAAVFFVTLGLMLAIYHATPGAKLITFPTTRLKYIAVPAILSLTLSFFVFYKVQIANSTNMKFANYYAQAAHNTNHKSEKATACLISMHYARQTDYASSYASKILLPLIYSICETDANALFAYMNLVLDYNPNHSIALLTRGNIYLYLNRPDLAAGDFNRAIDLLPNRAGGYIGLARVSEVIGRRQDAIQLYEKALELEPNNKDARAALANSVEQTTLSR